MNFLPRSCGRHAGRIFLLLTLARGATAVEPDVSPPRLLRRIEVELPSELGLGTRGLTVGLHLLVSKEGDVREVEVVSPQGRLIDDAVRAAALQFRFDPARRQGRPVAARIAYAYAIGEAARSQAGAASGQASAALGQGGAATRRYEDEGPRSAPLEDREPVPSSFEAVQPVVPETVAMTDQEEVEVVVTGSRMGERASEAVIATDVIRRAELEEQGARTVAEALEERPGLQIVQSFRGSELWLRGLGPRYVLVLVDGNRVPGRIGGAVDLRRYATEGLDRIELVRGPSSALYGADAIGGVVNLIPREAVRELEADAQVRLGQIGHDGSARIAGRPTSRLGLELEAGEQHTNAVAASAGPGTMASARTQHFLGGAVSWGAKRSNRLRLEGDYVRTRLTGVDTGAGGAVFDRTQVQEQAQIALSQRLTAGILQLEQRASYSVFREQYLLDQRNASSLDSYEENQDRVGHASSVLRIASTSSHRTTVGGEYLVEIMDSDRLSTQGRRTRGAAFAQHEWRIIDGAVQRLSVVPGTRFDFDSQFGSQLSPKLAARFDIDETWILRAGYGHGFRAPSFQELHLRFENPSVGYVVTGNSKLEAERARGVDVGMDLTADGLDVSVSVFRNDLTEMITPTVLSTDSSGTLFTYENLATAWTQGVEATLRFKPFEALSFLAGYAFTDTWDGEHGRAIQGQARHRPTLSMRAHHEASSTTFVARSSVSLERIYYQSDADGGPDREIVAPPLTLLDVRVTRAFSRAFELFAGVDNLLGTTDDYSIVLPRSFYVGARGRH